MISRVLSIFTLVASVLLASSPDRADWYEATSDHFVIYADDSEKDLRRYAENLERYHGAMEQLTGRRVGKPSPSNRVTIFVVGNQRELRKVAGTKSRSIAGFYVPRAGASRAFVQDIRNKTGYPDFSTIILLHEYAHHFLISSSRFEMPRWLSEGAAEFFAAASFQSDGTVLIGRVARHRGNELAYAEDVSVRELLDYELYAKNRGSGYDAFYGRSWLLYHYLTFNPDRRSQLDEYTKAIFDGASSIDAGERAFGDLRELEQELARYKRGRRFTMLEFEPGKLPIGRVTLRKLPKGEAKMMPLRIRSQRGVDAEEAEELVVEVREVAAYYPDDPGVLAALAEAEYDAGNDEAAIIAADRAIALDPTRANPYVQKGYAMFRMAGDAEDKEAAYKAAMKPFSQLNQLENDHPMPLIYYYRSFAERGAEPPETARHALERAAQLAPFDKDLWFRVAMMQMGEGKVGLARSALQPIANAPHGGGYSKRAKGLMTMLANVEEGTRPDPSNLLLSQTIEQVDVPTGTTSAGNDGAAEDDRDSAEGEAE